MLDHLILFHFFVADVDDAVGMHGDIVLVCDQDDGIAFLVQTPEQRHDFVARGSVEIASRLVGQQNRRATCRGADNDAGNMESVS